MAEECELAGFGPSWLGELPLSFWNLVELCWNCDAFFDVEDGFSNPLPGPVVIAISVFGVSLPATPADVEVAGVEDCGLAGVGAKEHWFKGAKPLGLKLLGAGPF